MIRGNLRAIELEANTERLDLLDTETNSQRLREMRAQAQALREKEPDVGTGAGGGAAGGRREEARSVMMPPLELIQEALGHARVPGVSDSARAWPPWEREREASK